MLDGVRQCFGISGRNIDRLPSIDSERRATTSSVEKTCIFCKVTQENGFDIVESNEEMIAFKDRNPAAKQHILVIPRRHISTVKDLGEADVPLLLRMEAMGSRLLAERGYPLDKQRLGYHIPPFSSVHHIHLHALSLPLKSWWRQLKYRSTTRASSHTAFVSESGKKWGWFVSSQDAIGILRGGQKIRIESSRHTQSNA